MTISRFQLPLWLAGFIIGYAGGDILDAGGRLVASSGAILLDAWIGFLSWFICIS